MTRSRAPLVVVPSGASAEEVAAVVAALTALAEEQRRATAAPADETGDRLDAWVRAARLSARRAGMTRGPWRLGARVGRRHRA